MIRSACSQGFCSRVSRCAQTSNVNFGDGLPKNSNNMDVIHKSILLGGFPARLDNL